MIAFPILGITFLLVALLLLFAPYTLLRLTELANTIIPVDQHIFKHRYFVGAFLFLSGLVMYWVSRTLPGMQTPLAVVTAILGAIHIIFGVLLVFAPRLLELVSNVGDRVIATDEFTIVHRRPTAIILILVALFMFYVYSYWGV